MTRAELVGVQIWGRPFKPLAVGMIVGGTTLTINTVLAFLELHTGIPIPGQSTTGPGTLAALLMGIFAGVGVFLMVLAWVIRSQRMYEWGLLLAFGGWVSRFVGITLDGDTWYALLPLSFALMAGGSYVLETVDARSEPARRKLAIMWRSAPQ